MMTFEEFFLKKKIELEDLAKGNPELFSEFRTHFEQMSEKSFDHTKKYWFNNLRHEFPLSEEKGTALKEAFKPKEIPSAPITEEIKQVTKSPKPSGFKPRFKAQNLAESSKPKAESENIEEGKTETTIPKPAGFKPRFKAGVTKPIESSDEPKTEAQPVEEKPKAAAPSGFKPRFKAGITKTSEEASKAEESQEKETDAPKTTAPSGFKPRFKAGQTSVKKDDTP